ncbi:hypothetical protein L9F63_019315, partial [Diploptera punctata]
KLPSLRLWRLLFSPPAPTPVSFIAGLGANFEYDLKKIIALSTLTQLGLIIRILSLGFAGLAFFHLLTHALFKALLFMCAGVVINCMKDSQDIRFIGNLSSQMLLIILNFQVDGFPLNALLICLYSSLPILMILVHFCLPILNFLTVCHCLSNAL